MNNNKDSSPLKNPLIIFLIISIVATILLNAAMISLQGSQKKEISYNEFITMLTEKKVDEVIISNNEINIYAKPEKEDTENLNLSSLLGMNSTDNKNREMFFTGYIYDEKLIDKLDAAGVKYSTPVEHENPILNFILTWILPLVIIYLLFFLFMRSMSKRMGGGGIMGIGQSNAKMYNVEDATGITFADVAGQEEAKESLD